MITSYLNIWHVFILYLNSQCYQKEPCRLECIDCHPSLHHLQLNENCLVRQLSCRHAISKRIQNLRRPGEIFTTDLPETSRQSNKKLPLFRRWSSNEAVSRPSLTPPSSPLVTTLTSTESTAFSPLSPPPLNTDRSRQDSAATEQQRIKELENQVRMLNKQLQELKTSLATKDMHISKLNISPPLEASDTDKSYFTLPLRRTSARDSLSLLGSSPNAKSNSSASLSLIHLLSQQPK